MTAYSKQRLTQRWLNICEINVGGSENVPQLNTDQIVDTREATDRSTNTTPTNLTKFVGLRCSPPQEWHHPLVNWTLRVVRQVQGETPFHSRATFGVRGKHSRDVRNRSCVSGEQCGGIRKLLWHLQCHFTSILEWLVNFQINGLTPDLKHDWWHGNQNGIHCHVATDYAKKFITNGIKFHEKPNQKFILNLKWYFQIPLNEKTCVLIALHHL